MRPRTSGKAATRSRVVSKHQAALGYLYLNLMAPRAPQPWTVLTSPEHPLCGVATMEVTFHTWPFLQGETAQD